MAEPWEGNLQRWLAASLIDPATADRIRAWEQEQSPHAGLRWPVLLAVAFGAVLLGAGILLFVSAHWDELSPAARMSLVVLLVAGFHVAGAFTANRFGALSLSLHAVGTISLGAGIALTGQIFNLDEHWPGGILLWSIGTVLGWVLLRHWSQYAIAAILIPAWLVSEWSVAMTDRGIHQATVIPAFLFLTALVYLTSHRDALSWIGGICLLPLGSFLWIEGTRTEPSWEWQAVGWTVGMGAPLALAFLLRRRAAVYHVAAAAWCVLVYGLNRGTDPDQLHNYLLFAVFAIGLIAWGLRDQHIGMINLGVAAFAITVFAFYFSRVMDKLGRSASLIALGVLFIGGGWLLERTRRRLVAQVRKEPNT